MAASAAEKRLLKRMQQAEDALARVELWQDRVDAHQLPRPGETTLLQHLKAQRELNGTLTKAVDRLMERVEAAERNLKRAVPVQGDSILYPNIYMLEEKAAEQLKWLTQESEQAAVARGRLVERLNRLEAWARSAARALGWDVPDLGAEGRLLAQSRINDQHNRLVDTALQAWRGIGPAPDVTDSPREMTQSNAIDHGKVDMDRRVAAIERLLQEVLAMVPPVPKVGEFMAYGLSRQTWSPLGAWIQYVTQQLPGIRSERTQELLARLERFFADEPQDVRQRNLAWFLEQVNVGRSDVEALKDFVFGPKRTMDMTREETQALGGYALSFETRLATLTRRLTKLETPWRVRLGIWWREFKNA